eukprot:2909012-Pyramimonas_sp.AAC.1
MLEMPSTIHSGRRRGPLVGRKLVSERGRSLSSTPTCRHDTVARGEQWDMRWWPTAPATGN